MNGSWNKLPITDEVIDQVEDLSIYDGAPIMKNGYPIFEWSPGGEIDDSDVQESPLIVDQVSTEMSLKSDANRTDKPILIEIRLMGMRERMEW